MAWIDEDDRKDFALYGEARAATTLLDQSARAEVILHRADDGPRSVIENRAITPWPPGHTLAVGCRVFAREGVAPSVTTGLLAPGHA
jgi:hypothetical protein